MVRMILIFHI